MATDQRWLKTFCGYCHANCGMEVLVRDGRMEKVKGDPDFPGNRGRLCPKGAAAVEVVYSPYRLQHPLVRTANGFEKVPWERALDLIAEKLQDIKGRHGPESVMQIRGAPMTEEVRDGFVQLMAAYGSPNATGPSHLCSTPRRLGQQLVLGARTVPDFERAGCIVIWGANPYDSRNYGEPLSLNRFDSAIPDAQKRGAKIIVIDPRRTRLAASADEWVNIAVGTDLALALALLNVVIEEKLYDRHFVESHTVGFERLSRHVRESTPEWAAGITGISAESIRRIARVYATTRPAAILDGNGLDQHPQVVQTLRAISMLLAITGNLDVPGGNVIAPKPKAAPYPTIKPKSRHLAADAIPLFPRVTVPFFIDALLTGKPYKPRALITHHANPLLINANYKKLRQALSELDLIVAYDILPSATAEMAHVVLPAASDFERHGYGAWPSFQGGFVALQRKVIEPLGESRNVFEVEYELATRLELQDRFPWKTNEEWVDYKLGPMGVTFEQLLKEHIVYVGPGVIHQKYRTGGFKTPSGKVELYSQRLADAGQDPLPAFRPFQEGPDLKNKYPLVGTTRRPGCFVHTRFRDVARLNKFQPGPLVRIHPRDAEARKIADKDPATVESPEGVIRATALVTDEIGPGLVIVDFGWGNSWDGGDNVNILTGDQPRCPISGATPNRRFRCEIRKVDRCKPANE
ncbi:MAG: molybdopterin-dependent oxidoreductase [Thermodesulfobacteriota bacterium]